MNNSNNLNLFCLHKHRVIYAVGKFFNYGFLTMV